MSESENRLEHERNILGAAYLRPSCIGEIVGQITADDFLQPAHRAIWATMVDLWVKEESLEPGIIVERVNRAGAAEPLAALGGAAFIVELPEECIVFETLSYHVNKIRRASQRYRWGQMLAKLAARATRTEETDEEFLDAIGSEVLRMMLVEGEKAQSSKEKTRKQVLREVVDAIEHAHKNRGSHCLGVPTGIADLDEASRGLRPGQLVILAARPGVGKSALMSQMVEHAAQAGAGSGAGRSPECLQRGPRLASCHDLPTQLGARADRAGTAGPRRPRRRR